MSRLVVPALAAALALAVTAPIVSDHAFARPMRPDHTSGIDRLRAENEQLRAELGYYQSAYNELYDGLDRIEAANRRNRDRRSSIMIDRAIRAARDGAGEFILTPDERGRIRDRRTKPAHPPGPQIQVMEMDARAFASLTATVSDASFADEKLAIVQSAAQRNYFKVAQVVALMKLASFDDTRVEIAVALAPRVLDGDKWFEVYGALTFSSSRDTLRERLGDR